MTPLFQFILVALLTLTAFTAGWMLRGFYSTEKEKTPPPLAHFTKKEPIVLKMQKEEITPPKPAPPSVPPLPQKPGPEDKYKKRNYKQLIKIGGSVFSLKGEWSFLVNGFSQEEKALKYLGTMKKRFPSWSLFIKSEKKYFNLYLGPFRTKKEAHEFINNLSSPLPFPNYFLQKKGL